MRIALLTDVLPPYRGGMVRAAVHHAQALQEAGHEVTWWSGAQQTDPSYATQKLSAWFRIGTASFAPALLWKLGSPEVVLVEYPCFGLLLPLVLWRLTHPRVQLIVYAHMDPIAAGIRGFIFSALTQTFGRLLLAQANVIGVSSLSYAQSSPYLRRYTATKVQHIPLAIDDFFLEPVSTRVRTQPPVVLFVGGLDAAHDFKGLSLLLEAARYQTTLWQLWCVGEGALRQHYEQQAQFYGISDCVQFFGALPDDALREVYRSASITVLPSTRRSEAFGLVLGESLACGTPIIASNLPGVNTLCDTSVGMLVPPGDVDALAAAIDTMLANHSQIEQRGAAGRARIADNYSFVAMRTALERVLTQTV